jgi:CheY-like chemotaxis protein
MPRCIIVDDHGDTRAGYAEFLGAFGFDVKTAADGEQLRALLKQWVPDAIVLDLQLPRTDGWQLTREIKSNPATRQIVIVVVSACVMPSEREAAEEAGSDAFIAKPCDPMDIITAVYDRLGLPIPGPS